MPSAKLFTNGRNQAVRIPKSMKFEGIDEVNVYKDGNRLILEPKRKTWLSFAEMESAGEGHMSDRPEILEMDRVEF